MTNSQPSQEPLSFFEEYAIDCLQKRDREVQEALTRRQIPTTNLQSLTTTYAIILRVKDGFTLGGKRLQILKQLEAIADFLRDFHIGILGQQTSLFQLYEVELFIPPQKGFFFKFSTGKLSLKLNLNLATIKKRWERGDHLSRSQRKFWSLFNPIGLFRSNLKAIVMTAIQRQVLGIDGLLRNLSLLEIEPESMTQTNFQSRAIAYLKTIINETKLGISLETVLGNQEEANILTFLQHYRENLHNPGEITSFLDTVTLKLQEFILQEQSRLNIKMFGLINVGNYHRIDVDIRYSLGYLEKYVDIQPREVEIKAILWGLINVYTVDDITIKPQLSQALKLDFETAIFEKTLKEVL